MSSRRRTKRNGVRANLSFPQYRNNDNLSAAVNKYFREHGHDKGEGGKRVFYSLRHSFEGRMTDAEVHNRKAALTTATF